MRCVKGMCGLKVAWSEENLGFKGLIIQKILCYTCIGKISIRHTGVGLAHAPLNYTYICIVSRTSGVCICTIRANYANGMAVWWEQLQWSFKPAVYTHGSIKHQSRLSQWRDTSGGSTRRSYVAWGPTYPDLEPSVTTVGHFN